MNETSAATTLEQVVDCYFAMWNETDPTARKVAIVSAWSPEASYTAPLLAAEGYDALDAIVVAVHERFPGYRFRLTGAIGMHHDSTVATFGTPLDITVAELAIESFFPADAGTAAVLRERATRAG